MATESGAQGQKPAAATQPSNIAAPPSAAAQGTKPAAAAQAAPATGEKKLTGAELKAKAKAEKAARRAASKVAAPPPPPSSSAGDSRGGKGKGKQDAPQGPATKARQGSLVQPPKEIKPTVPECFSHLSMAKRIPMTQADKDVHPAVLLLGQQMSAFVLRDSTKRLEATLLAMKKVGVSSAYTHLCFLCGQKNRAILTSSTPGHRVIHHTRRQHPFSAFYFSRSQPANPLSNRVQAYVFLHGQRHTVA